MKTYTINLHYTSYFLTTKIRYPKETGYAEPTVLIELYNNIGLYQISTIEFFITEENITNKYCKWLERCIKKDMKKYLTKITKRWYNKGTKEQER